MGDTTPSAAGSPMPTVSSPTSPGGTWRRAFFLSVFLAVNGLENVLFADYLWRTGLYGLKYAVLVLHAGLFPLVAFGFCNCLFGFFVLRTRPRLPMDPAEGDLPTTAIVFPIYNEDVGRVLGGVEATYKSLERAGLLGAFQLFLLSDSTNVNHWIEEEIAWFHLARKLHAFDRIHYRHRPQNTAQKSGNLSDFLEQWGGRYRYMIVFDADSLMTGRALGQMVRTMEANPTVGLIQTPPGIVRARTLLARSQQFVSRLCSRVFMAGMRYWQGAEGNYIGHNAIVRVKAFMDHCSLPRLPWREPLGGRIMSHDFVEAALMRRAGYEVWLADDIEESYEETPANLLESVARHRRWCQGDLQHIWLLFSRDLPLVNRCHFLLGILGYVSSLMWLAFLVVSTLVVIQFKRSGLTLIPVSGLTRSVPLSLTAHGAILFGFVFLLLLSPLAFSLLDLLFDRPRSRSFGGWGPTAAGACLLTVLSILLAPLFMVWLALFVATIPFGKGVAWKPPSRSQELGLSWRQAATTHGWLTLVGVGWIAVAAHYDRMLLLWLLPVLAPLVLSIPLNVLLASTGVGGWLRAHGLLVTPEETVAPPELADLEEAEREMERLLEPVRQHAAALALVDPFLNALHVAIQRRAATVRASAAPGELIARMASDEKSAAKPEFLRRLLLDDTACLEAHRTLWRLPEESLAPLWRELIASYLHPLRRNIFP